MSVSEELRQEKLLEAIGMVGDDLVSGAKAVKKKTKAKVIKLVAFVVAASVIVGFVWNSRVFVSADYSSKYNRTFGEFAARTTVEMLKERKENTCYSPVSLFAALAMTAEATKGETRREIIEALNVDNIEELEAMYRDMVQELDVDYDKAMVEGYTGEMVELDISSKITLCNSLWISNYYLDENSEKVIEECVKNMKADIFTKDIVEATEVNEWVSDKTEGVIDKILEDGEAYKLLMVNTLYYKAEWNPIKISLAQVDGKFKLEDGKIFETDFLHDTNDLRYKEMEKYTVVELPLMEGNLMLVLPKEGEDVNSIFKEKIFNEVLAMSTNGEMDSGCVDISFPEYVCESYFDDELIDAMKDIGIDTLFEENEWAISDKLKNELMVARQRTFIDVNFEGVVAGATTAMGPPLAIGPVPELEITYDRPFMYVLVKNGVPMFTGAVYNPVK